MPIAVGVATTGDERDAVYRLRYDVYVEEMRLFGDVADHARRMLSDASDATAPSLYFAVEDDQVIGTLRLHLGADGPFPAEFHASYDLARVAPAGSDVSIAICTRFMVRRPHRATLLPLLLMGEVARFAVERGVDVVLCDYQPHLIGLYRSLGFRSYTQVYNDPHVGIMMPLALIVGDVGYLTRIQSPLLDFASPSPERAAVAGRLIRSIARTPASGHGA